MLSLELRWEKGQWRMFCMDNAVYAKELKFRTKKEAMMYAQMKKVDVAFNKDGKRQFYVFSDKPLII